MMAIDDMTLNQEPFAANLCLSLKHQIASYMQQLDVLLDATADGE